MPFAGGKPIHTVFFDLGNTLVCSQGHGRPTMRKAARLMTNRLKALGYRLDTTAFTRLLLDSITNYHQRRDTDLFEVTTDKLLLNALRVAGFEDILAEHVVEGLEAYYGHTQSLWQPEADIEPTMRALEAQGVQMGLISNAAYAWDVQCLIDKCKIRPFLNHITISADVGLRKPHPDIYTHALRAVKSKPANALMVGDNLIADIMGANKVGLHTAWLSRRADPDQVKSAGAWIIPDVELTSLSELPALIGAHNRQCA